MPEDYANYVTFLQNLRNALDNGGLLSRAGLSITLVSYEAQLAEYLTLISQPSPSSYELSFFNIHAIEPIVDWFNISRCAVA
jgi:hypothetical protein